MFGNRFSQLSVAITISALLAGCGGADSGRKIYSQILTAPSELTAEVTSSTELTLTWNDNSETEESYRIERAVGDGDFAEIETTDPDADSFQDTTIESDKIYTYRVRAARQNGFSEFSNEESVKTVAPPNNLDGTALTISSIQLTWEDQSDYETGFAIQKRLTDSGPFTSVGTTDLDEESFPLESLDSGTCYDFQIYAFNNFGNSTSIQVDNICTPTSSWGIE